MLLSFTLIGSFNLIAQLNGKKFSACPSEKFYNNILNMGCYKVTLSLHATWSEARQNCDNDSDKLVGNTMPQAHLLAIENRMEYIGISQWLNGKYLLEKSVRYFFCYHFISLSAL